MAEARLVLLHHQRAIQAAKTAADGAKAILNVGQSPYTDQFLTSVISSVHLPLYPKLRQNTASAYSAELTRRVSDGELDLAIVAAGGEQSELVSIELSSSPLYLLIERSSRLAARAELSLLDLDGIPWILFASQVHPHLYEALAQRASKVGAVPSERQHVTSAEHAAQLVKSTGGVPLLTKRGAWGVAVDGLTMRPLVETGLTLRTVILARNDARRLVGDFLRATVTKVKSMHVPKQQKLPLLG